MWIKTQDNTALLNIIKFNVVKVFAGKHKGLLYGKYSGSSLFFSNSMIIGKYKTYNEALEELKNIEKAIVEQASEIYQVR